MLRYKRNVHMKEIYRPFTTSSQVEQFDLQTFVSMVVPGPSGSGKSVWTKELLLSSLIQHSLERIIWCYG